MKYYFRAFKNYAKCDGRATRKEYWLFVLFDCLFTFVFLLIDAYFALYPKIVTGYYVYYFNYGYLTLIYMLVSACPAICLQVRRLHDVGKSGGWWWAKNVPILNWYVFYLNCKAGDPRINAYGYPANYTPASAFGDDEQTDDLNQIRFCRKCGSRLIDGARFCDKCGTQVIEQVGGEENDLQ